MKSLNERNEELVGKKDSSILFSSECKPPVKQCCYVYSQNFPFIVIFGF